MPHKDAGAASGLSMWLINSVGLSIRIAVVALDGSELHGAALMAHRIMRAFDTATGCRTSLRSR